MDGGRGSGARAVSAARALRRRRRRGDGQRRRRHGRVRLGAAFEAGFAPQGAEFMQLERVPVPVGAGRGCQFRKRRQHKVWRRDRDGHGGRCGGRRWVACVRPCEWPALVRSLLWSRRRHATGWEFSSFSGDRVGVRLSRLVRASHRESRPGVAGRLGPIAKSCWGPERQTAGAVNVFQLHRFRSARRLYQAVAAAWRGPRSCETSAVTGPRPTITPPPLHHPPAPPTAALFAACFRHITWRPHPPAHPAMRLPWLALFEVGTPPSTSAVEIKLTHSMQAWAVARVHPLPLPHLRASPV